MADYTQRAAEKVVQVVQKQNSDVGAGQKQSGRVLKDEARDSLNAKIRANTKDTNQR